MKRAARTTAAAPAGLMRPPALVVTVLVVGDGPFVVVKLLAWVVAVEPVEVEHEVVVKLVPNIVTTVLLAL